MSKMFVTNRSNKGLEIVAGKYQFFDGLMKVSDADAQLLAPILVRFYGCSLEEADEAALAAAQDNVDPSLVASQTRAIESGSQAYVVDSMIAAGKAAGNPNVTGTLSGPAIRVGDEIALNTSADNDADPKNVSNQSIANETANHNATGGSGTGPVTGPTSATTAPVTATATKTDAKSDKK